MAKVIKKRTGVCGFTETVNGKEKSKRVSFKAYTADETKIKTATDAIAALTIYGSCFTETMELYDVN